jgi:hypothetical protein
VYLIFLASNSAAGFFTTGYIQVSFFFLNNYIHVTNSAILIQENYCNNFQDAGGICYEEQKLEINKFRSICAS